MSDALDAASRRPAAPLTIAWCLVAGAFLLAAPADPDLWGRVMGAHEALAGVLDATATRLAVSGFGLLLLLVATMDLAVVFSARRSR